jgi:ketol-acid reductoisomerase
MSQEIYQDGDANLAVLQGKTIAIIGYGNQGRSQALNMRDSGLKEVIVGNVKDESWKQARADGFAVHSIKDASQKGDILFILLPDEVAPEIYREEIEPGLEEGNVLNFASGYNITFGEIESPGDVDVIMVAPRMIGAVVRELYERGKGAPAFLAVEQDYSGKAKEIGLALSKGIGATRAGVIEVTFDMETKMDLLSEQTFGPIIFAAMMAKYELEVAEGIPPAAVLMELYLSGEISHVFGLMAKQGVLAQMDLHSQTSQYGQLSRLDEIIEGLRDEVNLEGIKKFMKRQLANIDSGKFAQEWRSERREGYPVFKRLFKKYRNSPFIKEEQDTIEKLGLKGE